MLLIKKEEIEAWLNQYQIKNYELIPNEEYGYVVNVNDNVIMNHCMLKNIEVKFNKVNGNFNCGFNGLTSLKGCPEIVTGDFNCYFNELKSLKYCPKIIGKELDCSYNVLESLKYVPSNLKKLDISNNNVSIDSLKFLSEVINLININHNPKLGNLQEIRDINELKEKVNIYFEKENLLNIIKKEELNKNINITKL